MIQNRWGECRFCAKAVQWSVEDNEDGWTARHFCNDEDSNHALIEITADNEDSMLIFIRSEKEEE